MAAISTTILNDVRYLQVSLNREDVMNPISSTTAAPAAGTTTATTAADAAASTASAQADFDQAYNQVLTSVGTSVLSLSLDDLIQISQEDV
jgi:hypothetical protein